MKVLFLIFLSFINLYAVSDSYEFLYDNIYKNDNNETQKTLRDYVIKSTYNVSAHQANYFLPISYRFEDNYENKKEGVPEPLQTETEFQISLKYDVTSNIFGFNEIYTIAYTQKSYWQLYVESAYFRESNYNPELFVTLPVTKFDADYSIKAVRLGFAHMSNGQGGVDERSWNYFYSNLYFQLKYLFVDLKLWVNSGKSSDKYNPDLLDYLGHGHIKFIFPYKEHLLNAKFRYSVKGYGAAEVNYTYPAFGREDVFFYLKGFSGYGESLIDYDNKVQKLGIGLSISR